MKQKIRITTRVSQFEKRKQEHLQAGYQIDDEQPFPVNGLCSFTAVRVVTDDDLAADSFSDKVRNLKTIDSDRSPQPTPEQD